MQAFPYSARRLLFVTGFFGLWMITLALRLYYLQIIQHDWLLQLATKQTQESLKLQTIRGEIQGKNGWILARSIPVMSLYADPSRVNIETLVARLAPMLSLDAGVLKTQLNEAKDNHRRFMWIARKLDLKKAETILNMKIDGLNGHEDRLRAYPFGKLGSHFLGYVGIDNDGLNGLEQTQNRFLSGEAGTRIFDTDARGHSFDYFEAGQTNGSTVITTIDEYLQTKAELLITTAAENARAAAATAIVLSPRTGEVLTIAVTPSFNPNDVRSSSGQVRRLDAVQHIHELGSIKSLLLSVANTDDSTKNPNQSTNQSQNGSNTFEAVEPKLELSNEQKCSYIKRFGFGEKTRIELPGETAGIIHCPEPETASKNFMVEDNPSVAASLIQITAALATVANEGVWVQPHIVKQVNGPDKTPTITIPLTRTVIDKRATDSITKAMTKFYLKASYGITDRSKDYDIAAYLSQVDEIDPYTRAYNQALFDTTIVGFAPSKNPQYVILVNFNKGVNKELTRRAIIQTFYRIVKAAFGAYAVSLEGI